MRNILRRLLRSPGFTLTSLATLAIGIGATTAVYSVVDKVLLEPLPYPDSEELIAIWHTAPGAEGLVDVEGGGLRVSPSMYFTYAQENRSFEHIGLWSSGTASVVTDGTPEEARIVNVTDGLLQALAVRPLLGRWLEAADMERRAGPASVMLTHGYWQRRFGGDQSVLGGVMTVDGFQVEIVGVMPEGFTVADVETDLIAPSAIDRSSLILPPFCCQAIARLEPGVSIDDANADIARMLPIWMDSWPFPGGNPRTVYEEGWQIGPALRPLKDDVVGGVGNVLWIVLGTIGIVLVIACANVTNLLLVRAESARHELAIRAALGAGSWRIARQLLLESVLLAMLGGALGLVLASAGLEFLVAAAPEGLPRVNELGLDGEAVAFAAAVSLLVGLILGAAPALKHAGAHVSTALRTGGRTASQSRARFRAQNILVVSQVALALVLLVGSGLMIRTFGALRDVEPGFTDGGTLQTVRVSVPSALVPERERVTLTQQAILEAVEAVPGVTSAGFVNSLPLSGYGDWNGVIAEGEPGQPDPETGAIRRFNYVSPGYFAAAGTRLIAGRDLTWNEILDARPVVMISENLAREIWGSPEAAIGRRLGTSASSPWREIVGVVQNVHAEGLDTPPPPTVYWPPVVADLYTDDPWFQVRNVSVVVRSPLAGTAGFVRALEQAVWSVNPGLSIASVQRMQDVYDDSLARTSFTLVMLGISGAVALALGIVGLYGVLAYVVSQRRREIAIRLAVGAQQFAVRLRFVRQGITLAVIGIALGLGAAALVTRLMTSLLFDVEALDPLTYAAAAVVLTAVAALASYLPARRASAVDPIEALASE